MKPLNLDNKPCSPTSSNCVIWQGPDIPCIKICKGDSVSDVVAALATELCTILDQTNVSNYDLSCLDITACGPKDFQALIQLLIEKICELEGVPAADSKSTDGCPDCIVTVASCFRNGNATTMQLLDYVQMIAEKVCSLIDDIGAINTQITDILIRLEELENTPPPDSSIPAFTLTCTIGSLTGTSSQYINVILEEFINNVWCPFYVATGTTADLIDAVNAKCINDGDIQASTGTTFASNPNWIQDSNYSTVADAINNIWVALCDVYNAVSNISLNVVDTNTVNLTLSSGILTADVQDTGWVRLNGFDYIPDNNAASPPMVRRIGNVLHFRGTIIIPLANGSNPLTWNYVSNTDSYFYVFNCAPFTGAGGVYKNSNGSVVFNYSGSGTTCNSVIPASVLPAGYVIDGRYQNPAGWKVATRSVPIDYNPESQTSDNSTVLTTVFSQVIGTDGTLTLGLLKDTEATWVSGAGGNNSFDTSHLNYIISHVAQNDKVPQYNTSSNIVHSFTPTVIPANPGGPQDVNLDFPTGYYYPFSCNANDEDNIGGFIQRLDGLTAFISPCGTTIPTPNPCPKG